jgi:hypothetical protein
MKKIVLVLAPVITLLMGTSCNDRMYQNSSNASAVNTAEYMPFTKDLKYRLEQDHADLKKIQFYTDKPLVLRFTSNAGASSIKGGMVTYDNSQSVTEIEIPAFTPGVCEKIKGDSLFVSFDAPQNSFVFASLYANDHFMLQGTNWYNGVCDVNYDNKIYKAQCDGCGSAGEVKLMIKRGTPGTAGSNTSASGAKALKGRTVR